MSLIACYQVLGEEEAICERKQDDSADQLESLVGLPLRLSKNHS